MRKDYNMKATYQIYILFRGKYDRGWRGGEAVEGELGEVIAANPTQAVRDYITSLGRADEYELVGDYALLDDVVYYADCEYE
jgi:hypothetical protein